MRRLWTIALLPLLAASPAAAHVQASPDVNNRYIKLTPMSDRLRLSYTVLIGEAPARIARQVLDTDRDGQLSEAEANAWGQDVAAKVAAGLELTIDGQPVAVTWTEVYVGLDTPAVTAGSFSLDLIAWLCAPGGARQHDVALADRFAVNPPGETELTVEGQPGVKVVALSIDGRDVPGHHVTFEGNSTPLANGVHLVYRSDQPGLADGRCPKAPSRKHDDHPRWPWVAGGLAIVALAAAALALRRRR